MTPLLIIAVVLLALYAVARTDKPRPGFYHGWNGRGWDDE